MATTVKGFPYPANTDPVNIPGDLNALAAAIDSFLSNIQGTNGSLLSPTETITVAAIAATGTVNFDVKTQGILYYENAATANHTLNFRGDSVSTLDSILNIGEVVTLVFLNTNGATPYYPNVIKIDGTTVTPKWSGGTAPSAGNASAIDAYTFSIIKTAAGTFTVLAGAVKFA